MVARTLSASPLGVEQTRPVRADINPVFGMVRAAGTDPLHFFLNVAKGNDVVELPNPFGPFYLVNHPDYVERILQGNWRNYPKSEYYMRAKPVFGDGLFILEGETWKRKRQLVQPAFKRDAIDRMVSLIATETAKSLDTWKPLVGTGREIDILPPLTQMALSIITRALCSDPIPGDLDEITDAFTVMMRKAEKVLWSLFPFMHALPSPSRSRLKKAQRVIDTAMFQIIQKRIDDPRPRGDLMDMLLASRNPETGEPLSLREMRDDLITMLIAGHETTALSIAWGCYELSRNPGLLQRLGAEVGAVLQGRQPTLEDLAQMPLLERTVKEALRLYTPFWTSSRKAAEDDQLGGYTIPKGATVMISPYVMHRNPRYWTNPEAFDPDRFLPENEAGRPEYAYFPFGGGPRVCIGKRLAMIEAQIYLAMLVQRFDLHLAPGHKMDVEPMISLRPKYGIHMTVHNAQR